MTEEGKEKGLNILKDTAPREIDTVLGAWISGMGFVLLLIGLSVWVKATCREEAAIN